MKGKIILIIGAGMSGLVLLAPSAIAQGSLTPPGAPAPTMKSLSQIEPGTPINSVPFTISSPGFYYATTNLTVPTGEFGISIDANNVTLDLNGFTLTGVSQSFDGIVALSPQTNVVIRNGTLINWANGVVLNAGSNVSVERLAISGVGGWGVHLEGSVAVRDCMMQGSRDSGFDGIFITGGLVSDCVITANGGNGIEADSALIRNCLIESNSGNGIILHANCQAIGNSLIGNTGADAIEAVGNNNRIEDNHLTGVGAGIGIFVLTPATNNVIIKNSAAGFGTADYSVAAGNDLGPVGAATTATSPWANISH